jgi:hypothetical protein
MESVSDSLRRLVETKHRFTSVEAGWHRFLHYLHERNGADIDGAHRSEIVTHLNYIDDAVLDPDADRDENKMAGLDAFAEYDDVIAAFQKFCQVEMLPAS